ncbi:MAG: bifunctional hydroxymethylpyrimidine kinase/phosphomethylpyrimidine kinase [Actinomycetaceae bacterium]|nr:bifunctional hydroxymethylpyrimidine kinase/phosphomethylpyrimidine kinase [Actinomycetaceae bacterium]
MSTKPSIPRILSIAGTDPTGGAGAQADLKSIQAAGGFGLSVITAVLAQNTCGVQAIEPLSPTFLRKQLDSVSDDVQIDAIKIGMLGSVELIDALGAWMDNNPVNVVVIDPVMVATSGDRLLEPQAEAALCEFLKCATVITPNIPELAVIAGAQPATTFAQALQQGHQVASDLGVSVVVKGGHLDSDLASNALIGPDGTVSQLDVPRLNTSSTHGTGCSLSSALATRLCIDTSEAAALSWATRWLWEAIDNGQALLVGKGHGPVDHSHRARRLERAANNQPWAHRTQEFSHWEDPGDHVLAKLWTAPTKTPPSGQIPVAGAWTKALWQAGEPIWMEILDLDFVRHLSEGNLPKEEFETYLNQDAYYLEEYSRALAAVSVKAPDVPTQHFWAGCAQAALAEEQNLHMTWLKDRGRTGGISPVTSGYTSMLKLAAIGDSYAVGAAAVLPCFWLYCEIGLQIAKLNRVDHPYRAWIDEYRNEDFLNATTEAIVLVEKALERASAEERARAAMAYLDACTWEREFFDQASRMW